MFEHPWRIGRVAGIEIRVDASWAIIALLITYSLSLYFDQTYPSLSPAAAFGLGLGTSVLFFASVLLHELAHATTARRRGMTVEGITLFLFGGATHAKVESRGPTDEMVVTIVGPFTSLLLAGAFGGIALGLRDALPDSIAGAFGYLAWINLALAIFNLVPGFPLDGGRILRAAVWRSTGDLGKATRIASAAGRNVGILFIAAGFVLFVGGALIGGLWIAAIGWFLTQAARAAGAGQRAEELLEEATAGTVMAGNLVSIAEDLTIQDAVDRYFLRYDMSAFPVERDGATVGLLTLSGVKHIARDEWPRTRVATVMRPLDDAWLVSLDSPMRPVIEKLEHARRVLVIDDGVVVGIITPNDVAAWLRRRQRFDDRMAA